MYHGHDGHLEPLRRQIMFLPGGYLVISAWLGLAFVSTKRRFGNERRRAEIRADLLQG